MSKTVDILNQGLPRLAPAAAGDPFNFIYEIMDFLVRWCSTYQLPAELSGEAYCCFVGFERVLDAVQGRSGFARQALFREDTPQDLLGTLYFSSMTVSSVFSQKRTLKSFTDCEALITELGAANQPVILFNAAERRVMWRTKAGADIHQAVLRQVQFFASTGRSDLLVLFRSEDVVFYVELKVLRAFIPAGSSRKAVPVEDMIAWGKKGIAQAYDYKRGNRGVGTAYACCFDARANDEGIQELVKFATQMSVEYRRFFMYRTADLMHAALVNAASRH